MAEQVLLTTVPSRPEAEVLRSALAAAGIDSLISSDDCGSVDPALAFVRGVQVLVACKDLERATEVLLAPTTIE